VRREPLFVLALSAGTPYRNRQLNLVLSHIARACRSRGRLVAFLGCANAQLLAHAGLLHGSGGIVAGKGRARPSHRGSAMIGGLALLHKQFQETGRLSWRAARGCSQAIGLALLPNATPAPHGCELKVKANNHSPSAPLPRGTR
jgi:hypothetical protein